MPNFRDELRSILEQHVSAAVDDAIEAYRRLLREGGSSNGRRGRGRATASGTTTTRRRRRVATTPRTCPVPGCQNPSKGPRFRFFCAEHRDLPRAEQDRILAEAKAQSGSASSTTAVAPAARKARRRKAK